MYLDAHCHIDHLDTDQISDYISSFSYERWSWLVCIWTNLQDSQQNFQIYQDIWDVCCEKWVKVGYTVGIHPWSVQDLNDQAMIKIEDMIKRWSGNHQKLGGFVGIWEIWTDLHYNIDSQAHSKQLEYFDKQCKLAIKYNLPVVIHSRDDFKGTLEVIRKYQNLKVYFHCWWYNKEELDVLKSIFEDNLWIGFCGNISYPKATQLRESFNHAWKNNIKVLIETDAPYLSIQSLRWQTNHSKNISLHYKYISEFFDINEDELINQIRQNYIWLYW